MSSDISRQRFDPANNFNSVLMQQGRVQLDADWNEWNDILDRHWRSETIDIIGRGVVPLETPNGFEIQISGTSLTIGRGRIYVDGLQAENHGTGDQEFDPVLGESRALDPIPYAQQPYFPGAPDAPNQGGPHLVFLDVWEREVTAVENPTAEHQQDADAHRSLANNPERSGKEIATRFSVVPFGRVSG